MKAKEFFGKFKSPFLWGNLLAMVLVVVGLCFGVKYGLEAYTHHDESVVVPSLVRMSATDARRLLAEKGLEMMVADSGYNKQFAADGILLQTPNPGMRVKLGRTIYVTVNSPSSPTFPLPDIVDNSSFREAEARLTALGFQLLPPKRIVGERDWVYGVLCRGRHVSAGEHVSIEVPLTLVIGNGQYGENDDMDDMEVELDGDDGFAIVTGAEDLLKNESDSESGSEIDE